MGEPVNIRPGVRELMPADLYAAMAAGVTEPLLALGRACNDAGAMAASAVLDCAKARDSQRRLGLAGHASDSIESRIAERLADAASGHADQVCAIYAAVAAQYVTAAVEAVSYAINQRKVTVPDVAATDVADILLLAEIHVPLIQLDETVLRDPRRAEVENASLRDVHEVLRQMTALTLKYDVVQTDDGTHQFAAGPELGGALHEYATACIFALAHIGASSQSDG